MSTICKIRFMGNIERFSSTFPLLNAVKTKYQSVHGVTSSIIRPRRTSTESGKNITPNKNAMIGVTTKLIERETRAYRVFLKDSLNLPRSTVRNSTYSNAIKKSSTHQLETFPKAVVSPNNKPINATPNIIRGCIFAPSNILLHQILLD